jgi:hypothetical protein
MLIDRPENRPNFGRLANAHTMIEVGHKLDPIKMRTRGAAGGAGGRTMSIDSRPDKFPDICDGSRLWGSKGNAVRGNFPNAAAAPATVSGESFVICHWESRSWEGDEG